MHPSFLPHNPPWGAQEDVRRIHLNLPIHRHSLQTLTQTEPRIILYVTTPRATTALLPFKALRMNRADEISSTMQLKEPHIERIELDSVISAEFLRQVVLRSHDFCDMLRMRASCGLHVRSIMLAVVRSQHELPVFSLKEAARSWGNGVDVQCEVRKDGVELVFQPVQ